MHKKVIFHIPHDGNEFPSKLMKSVIVPHNVFYEYHRIMRDTDATMFVPECENSQIVKFNTSRLLCDVERFIGEEEIMEQYGMGFCYERAFDGTVIKNITDDLIKETYNLYMRHHNKIDQIIENTTLPIVFVDLHSFSKEIIVHRKVNEVLPDICIGFDNYISASSIQKIVLSFEENGFSVELNNPYTGSFTPDCIISGKIQRNITSFMVEVNKSAYRNKDVTDILCVKRIRNSIYNAIKDL